MASVFGGGIMWDTSNPSQHSKKKVKVKHNNKKKKKKKKSAKFMHIESGVICDSLYYFYVGIFIYGLVFVIRV